MARGGSKRGSARGRGRGRAAQSQTQDYPYTPPMLRSRGVVPQDYPYTPPLLRSRGVVPQLLPLPPSGSVTRTPLLRSAVRCLRENRETAVAVLPSQPAGDNPVYEDGLEDVKPSSLPSGSLIIEAPCIEHEMESDALCTQTTSQADGSQQRAAQPIMLGENSEVPRLEITATADHVPPSLSHSHNMTEFARHVTNESDDEVVSAPGVDYECLNGHKVKIGIAHLVRAIIRKHGDIISDCKVRSSSLFSFLLERMCDVYKTLEKKRLFDLTHDEVNIMRDELQLCEHHKLKVGWLLERLQQISEIMSSSRAYLMLKEEAEACMQSKKSLKMQVEKQRSHVDLILKNISMSEKKMEEEEAKAYKCMQKASEIKARVKPLLNQCLVYGLL